jgi:hypothetical protein
MLRELIDPIADFGKGRFFRGNGLTQAEAGLLKLVALTDYRIDHPEESID